MSAIRVLIADDHAIVREGLRTLIASEPGMELVGEAADGIEVVMKARSLQPDVILMDLLMPRKDGLDALEEIHQLDPMARVIVLTALDQPLVAGRAVLNGAKDFMTKPVRPERLLAALEKVLG